MYESTIRLGDSSFNIQDFISTPINLKRTKKGEEFISLRYPPVGTTTTKSNSTYTPKKKSLKAPASHLKRETSEWVNKETLLRNLREPPFPWRGKVHNKSPNYFLCA